MNTVISPVNIEDRQKLGVKAGDTVRVWQKIEEKGKTRLQAFEGIVLARKHGNEAGATFTVRRVSGGVGVEKIFPLYSPAIDKIEIVKRAKVRRAKLYYIREKVAREIRRQMRNMNMVNLSTTSDIDEKAERDSAEAAASEEAAKENKDAEVDQKAEADEIKPEEAPKEEKTEEEAKEAPEEEKTEEKPSEE